MVRVKICGVTNETDLGGVERAGADAVGVIAAVPVDTPREVSLGTATRLLDSAPPFLTTTLVTMPETPADAVEVSERVRPDVLQLHGDFAPDVFTEIRESVQASVVAVVDAAAPERAREVAPAVDGILVDSVDSEGAGGTGETHDWTATAEVASTLDAPVILAGGLHPGNVADAVGTVRPFAVDVASGVEASGEDKDPDAVRAFVANAKRAGERDADIDGPIEAEEVSS
ncbi:phosphoribosylanthranilate isomerase [Halobellus clavatus]|uniref:N-(5'-phosphoribosyl)anthranilate isomerase n=1 Tax=Halobellus clavatus TaxID=660517 RepID=A0A1H3EWY3_9EURY|nr:phosphoribosylanthranilate isomerase [Halobellus clavatus]SDX83302.1 phosphoribosylanthranilate isomerase [Halobellus clavatus]